VSALAMSVGVRGVVPMSGWVVTQLVTQTRSEAVSHAPTQSCTQRCLLFSPAGDDTEVKRRYGTRAREPGGQERPILAFEYSLRPEAGVR
jgi:hypothetical protein